MAAAKKRCFVVMGFGLKTDDATGRMLDLNKSYGLLIKPVVESKGLECIRADEMLYSGTIDQPMYHELLKADGFKSLHHKGGADRRYDLCQLYPQTGAGPL